MSEKVVDLKIIISAKNEREGLKDATKWSVEDAYKVLADAVDGRKITKSVTIYQLDDGFLGVISTGVTTIEQLGMIEYAKKLS